MRSPGYVGLPACLSARAQPGAVAARTLRGPRDALAPGLVLASDRGVEHATELRLRRAQQALNAAGSLDGSNSVVQVQGRALRRKPATLAVRLLPSHGADAFGGFTHSLIGDSDDDFVGVGIGGSTYAPPPPHARAHAALAAQRAPALRNERSELAPVSMRASFLLGGDAGEPGGPSAPHVRAAAGLSDSLHPRTSPVFAAGRALASASLAHAQLARLFAVAH
jgi:hypothetical protein